MHYGTLVVIERDGIEGPLDVESKIDTMLEGDHGWFDWYAIGGRWRGSLPGPTQLFGMDVLPVEDLTDEQLENFFYFVFEGYGTHAPFGGEDYLPWKTDIQDRFVKREKPPLSWIKEEFKGHLAVAVDAHN